MKTDELIRTLAADTLPDPSPERWLGRAMPAALGFVALVLLSAVGIRADLGEALEQLANGHQGRSAWGATQWLGRRRAQYAQGVFEDGWHGRMKAVQFQQPVIGASAEGQFNSGLAGILLQRAQACFQEWQHAFCGDCPQTPAQVNRSFAVMGRNRRAEAHRRQIAATAQAILSEGAQAPVSAGLSTNQAGTDRLFRCKEKWIGCWQLPGVQAGEDGPGLHLCQHGFKGRHGLIRQLHLALLAVQAGQFHCATDVHLTLLQ